MVFLKLANKICLSSFLFFSFFAEGLNSPYISIFTPEEWTCVNYPPNHICHPEESPKDKKIFVLISAKMGSKSDRLSNYLNHNPSNSYQTKELILNSHKWLDFLPENDYRKKYITRKQVSICCEDLNYIFHITVGFYVAKLAYPEYASLIVRMINSFELKKKNARQIEKMLKNQDPRNVDKMTNYIGNILSEEESAELDSQNKQADGSLLWLWVLALLLFCLPLSLFIKRKRKLKALKKKKLYKKKRP